MSEETTPETETTSSAASSETVTKKVAKASKSAAPSGNTIKETLPDLWAIVRTGGKQYRVTPGQELLVELLPAETGEQVTFTDVLMVSKKGDLKVGQPVVEGVEVKATVLGLHRGPKTVSFKKRRRKGYTVKKGHRQDLCKVRIEAVA